jgi:PAS domain S-box-containing protein
MMRIMSIRRSRQTSTAPKYPEKPDRAAAPGVRPIAETDSVDFQRLFELLPDPQIVMDGEGRLLAANNAACLLTGYTAAELSGLRLSDLVSPTDHVAVHDSLRRSHDAAPRHPQGVTLQTKSGGTLSADLRVTPIGPELYVAAMHDASTREGEIMQLRRTIDAHAVLVELGGTALVSVGEDGRISQWNAAAERLFGYTAAEAAGLPLASLIPSRYRNRHLEALHHQMQRSESRILGRVLHVDALRRDGSEMLVEVQIAVGRHGPGHVATAIVRDVSELRAVVEQLNDALQRLQFHVQCMPLAYVVWDREFRVVDWNPAAERLFGYAKAEAVGMHAPAIFHPDARPAVEEVLTGLLRGDASSHSIHDNVRKDGSRLACEWFGSALRDSTGRIHGIASMARDVTDREVLESRIRNAQKLESLGVLASGVAHDFNSSLMIILGNTSLLRATKNLTLKATEHLEAIEEAGLRASHLIKHLLAYARTGRHNPQPTNLNDVIRDCLRFVQTSLGKKHKIRPELADELPTILADRSQIEQIILNLCLNAKQAMPKGGEIVVSTQTLNLSVAHAALCVPFDARDGEKVELSVKDAGCGMDEATITRIFDPFFTTKADGHGLGLAAVLGILRQHLGAARVDSAPGRGTTMHIYLPVQRDD